MESSFQCQKIEDLPESQQIYKKPKKQSKYENSINSGQWSQDEVLKYIIFIDKNRISLASRSKRRIGKVFKQMANFMFTRNAIQCRSHHQKQLQKFKNTSKIINFFKNQYGQTSYNKKTIQFLPIQVNLSEGGDKQMSQDQSNKSLHQKNVQIQTDMAGIDKKIVFVHNSPNNLDLSTFKESHHPQQYFSYFPTFSWNPLFYHGP